MHRDAVVIDRQLINTDQIYHSLHDHATPHAGRHLGQVAKLPLRFPPGSARPSGWPGTKMKLPPRPGGGAAAGSCLH